MPGFDDRPCLCKQTGRDDRLECSISPDPHLHWVLSTFVFELEGAPIVDICSDIFRVGQDLMNRCAGPRAPMLTQNATLITPEKFPYCARSRIDGLLPVDFRENIVDARWTYARIARLRRTEAGSGTLKRSSPLIGPFS